LKFLHRLQDGLAGEHDVVARDPQEPLLAKDALLAVMCLRASSWLRGVCSITWMPSWRAASRWIRAASTASASLAS
jgi:hypothetical protein